MKLIATKYIARITGTDPKFKFARTFLGEKSGKTCEAEITEAGLYESGDEVFIASIDPSGIIKKVAIDATRAAKLARRIDSGDQINWRQEALPELIDVCKTRIRQLVNKPGGESSAKIWRDALALYEDELAKIVA